MTFGLRNAAQSFQRLMHSVLFDMSFCFVYLDDILIASKSMEEHVTHLKLVFQRLLQAGLVINVDKCVFAQTEASFLGHLVNAKGILPSQERVKVISQFDRPITVQQLKRFLGMINFYRRFIPAAARDQALLNNFLKGYRKNSKVPIVWSDQAVEAFENCKVKLCEATVLAHPVMSARMSIMTDASDTAVGAVVQQLVDQVWQPLGFFSIRLTPTQQKYSAYDRELLAAYLGIKHFKYLLEGREFTLLTDHRPLIYAFNQSLDKASPRQRRQLDYIGQFTTDLRHVSGADNVVADALSRVEQIELAESIDYTAVADAQSQDKELLELLSDGKSALKFEQVPIQFSSNKSLWCDMSTGKPRPYIPLQLRKKVFESFHNLAHPGVKTSVRLLTNNVVWRSINKDVRVMAQSCIACQRAKISRHTKSPTGQFIPTTERFSEVHLDLIGPLPISENNRYCVTLIDRYTRWAEAIPVQDITAPTVAFAVYSTWIARFGVPKFIITDQGSQFESHLFRELSVYLGFEHKRTTAYNPKCNGMVERWHRTLKAALMCHNRDDWSRILPSVLLGLRTSFREELEASSAELVYGKGIRIPGQFWEASKHTVAQSDFVENLKQHFEELGPVSATRHATSKVFVSKELEDCSHVFIRTDALRRALQPPYTGPHKVVERFTKFFDIEVGSKKTRVSIDRLKPCFSETFWDGCDEPVHPQVVEPSEANRESISGAASQGRRVTFASDPVQNLKPTFTRAGRVVTHWRGSVWRRYVCA